MSTEAVIAIAVSAGFVLYFLMLLLPDILKSWHGSRAEAAQAETEAAKVALKRDMVARGFSANEIARVINAGAEAEAVAEEKSPAPTGRT